MRKPSVARPLDLQDAERSFCVALAYTLMELRRRDRDKFDAITNVIFESVPHARTWDGRALLRELLIVKGGKRGTA